MLNSPNSLANISQMNNSRKSFEQKYYVQKNILTFLKNIVDNY